MTRESLISPFVSIRFFLVFIFFHLCSTTDVCFSNSGEQIEFLKAGVVKISARLGNMPRFGTGIIAKIEENSIYIVTVSHVVEGDPKPFINFYKRPDHSYPSRIIGLEGDDPKGLALLVVEDDQIHHRGLKTLLVDEEMSFTGGEKGILIGFPRLSSTPWMVTPVTIGGRFGGNLTFSGNADEGNSGGPIIIDGRVIGLITRTANQFGYAIPAVAIRYALEGWNILDQKKKVNPPDTFQSPSNNESLFNLNSQAISSKLIRLLEKELLYKNQQIANLTQLLFPFSDSKPSPLAGELASKIPENSDPYLLALKAMGEENFPKAKSHLESIIKDHQIELGKAYLTYGRIEESTLNFNQAEEWYKKALNESPKDPDIMEGLGRVLFQNSKFSEAEIVFLNALNIAESLFGINHPRVFEIKSYLPLVKSALGKNETALGLAEELLQFWKDFKSPEHHMVGIFQGLIGQINTWMGNFEKADEAFTKGIDVLKKSPTTDTDILGGAWCWAAMSPLMSERYEKAVYLLNQGLNTQFQLKFFTQWLCHFYLGLAYGGQHQWPLAENHMKKALRLTKEGIGERAILKSSV